VGVRAAAAAGAAAAIAVIAGRERKPDYQRNADNADKSEYVLHKYSYLVRSNDRTV
jgi:hypothetical protein